MKRLISSLIACSLWAIPAQAQTNITIPASLTCSDGFAIVFASGLPTCAATSGVGTVTNTAFTTGTIPKASGGAALVDSLITESGSTITVTGTFNATTAVQLNGTPYASPAAIAHLAGSAFTGAISTTTSFTGTATGVGAYKFGTSSFADGIVNILGNGSGSNVLVIKPGSASSVFLTENQAGSVTAKITDVGGLVMGAATGGDKGFGTINASAVYDDGVLLSDWVFEDAYGAQQAQRPSERTRGPKMQRRVFSLDETKQVTQGQKRLPWMPTPQEFDETERSIGGMMTRLWVGQEQQMLYIFDLESRIAALEKGKK